MKRLIEYAISCGCEHFAVNYNFCKCVNDHVTVAGPSKTCPMCAAPIVEQYTRIVGYYTQVSAWNKGRREEHSLRFFVKPDYYAISTGTGLPEGLVPLSNCDSCSSARTGSN